MQPLYGDQLLVSVFAKHVGSTFRITNENDIIKAFYNANNSGKYNELFENYAFDADGVDVHSYTLEEAIDSLQQTRLLGRLNPDLKEYKIQEAVSYRYNNFIKDNLSSEQRAAIDQLASDIEQQLQFQK